MRPWQWEPKPRTHEPKQERRDWFPIWLIVLAHIFLLALELLGY